MPNYTDLMNLYLPNRADSTVELDVSLADNFTKIDNAFKDLSGVFGVSVKQFGADATGATSASTAIANAIASASSNGLKKIYFPNGTYRLDTTVAIPADFEINCQNGAIFQRGVSTLSTLFTISSGVSWNGGQFNQNSSFTTDCCNLKLNPDADGVQILRTVHYNIVGDAIWLQGATNCLIEGNFFRIYRPQAGINCIMIYVDRSPTTKKGCDTVTISNNTAKPQTTEYATDFISQRGATSPPALSDYQHRRFQIVNNNVANMDGYGVHIRGLAYSNISDNVFNDTKDASIYLRGYDTAEWVNASGTAITVGTLVTDNTVNGNVLYMNPASSNRYAVFIGQGQETISARNISVSNNVTKYGGIQFDKTQNGSATGNNMSSCTGASGFIFDTCNGATCVGNSIDGATYGVSIISSPNSVVAGNTIRSIQQSGIRTTGTSTYPMINGNHLYDVGIATNATWFGIDLASGATYGIIVGNRVYNASANKPQYGIRLQAGANFNSYFGNKFTGGFVTAYKLDSGTSNSEASTNS